MVLALADSRGLVDDIEPDRHLLSEALDCLMPRALCVLVINQSLVINVSGTPRSPSHGGRALLLCTPEGAIG